MECGKENKIKIKQFFSLFISDLKKTLLKYHQIFFWLTLHTFSFTQTLHTCNSSHQGLKLVLFYSIFTG